MSLSKTRFAQQMIDLHQKMAEIMDNAVVLEKEFFDQGYNVGGANPLVDGDIVNLGITAANVASGITTLQQVKKFFTNQAVIVADYSATVNAFRRAGV
jgi:hypothetical protein